jgi:hypothetical protein
MTLTLPELIERLKQLDEITLLELLGITSEDLVDRFSDVIEDKQDKLTNIVDWE